MYMYVLLLIVIGLTSFHILTRYSKRGRLLSKIPGPWPWPIIGNLLLFTDPSQVGMWRTTRKLSDSYYPICKGWALHKPFVSIRHPDDIEAVLTSKKSSFKEFPYTYLKPWLGKGLLTNNGASYKHRRKLLTPAFHFSMLRGYINVINEQADRFINELRDEGDKFKIDVLPIFTDVSLNITIETSMGIEIDKGDKKIIHDYKESIEDLGNIMVYRMMRPYLPDWLLRTPLLKVGRKQRRAIKILHDFTYRIIRERKKYLENGGCKLQGFQEFKENLESEESQNIYTIEHKKKLPMLDILLAIERDGLIDEEGIREEVDTILLGGTDTTRMVMSYFTILLAENKNCQDKAREEVRVILDESGGKTGFIELQQMHYLERCLKETMRIFPIAGTLFRHTVDDVQLKNFAIPSNVTVILNVFDTHRDENFWQEPLKFDPDRFLPENIINRHPFAYVPFSAGPRNCIGQKFAWLELKAVCSRLLYNFYLEPVNHSSDIVLIGDLITRPNDPFYTKFIRIDKK